MFLATFAVWRETFPSSGGVFEIGSRDSDENPSFATKSPGHEEKSFDSVTFCETS
jgi:hypothetical protein